MKDGLAPRPPTTPIDADICVIGAGSAGLSVAAGAAQMGARIVLIERGKMGGDCLNYGCVPSKSLLAAAHAAAAARAARFFGVTVSEPAIDACLVHDHVQQVIAAIAPHDSVERFEGLGVRVIRGHGRFIGPDEVAVETEGVRIRARRFVIATGSSPAVPPIPGLSEVPFLTNETIFDLTAAPAHLIIIGGGPIGVEMAQAHAQLGARVSIIEMASLLPKDDCELVAVVRQRLAGDGVTVHERTRVISAANTPSGIRVVVAGPDERDRPMEGSHLLVAAGRRPNIAELGLEKAGVAWSDGGISVDRRLRTANPRIYAIGDVVGGPQFTHVAGYHAGIVIRNALFRLPATVDLKAVPWVTYTQPELAQVGLTEALAVRQHANVRVLRWPYRDNDRAQAERLTDGLIKVVVSPRGRILGAGIVGAAAGELIQPWVLAIGEGLKIGAMARMIAPYPTLGEISKRAAGSFYTASLFSERTRRIVRWLARFG
jgi:pyruvate/2-oxoglutarate dehydrogenase complex dihydrolipoamide dehydrogenase (E3) component